MFAQTINAIATIMLIDDDPTTVQPLYGLLVREGYEVQPITQVEDATEAIRSAAPDLILLSSALRAADAYQVCSQLRHDFPYVAVLMLSSSRFDDVRAFSAGAADYLEYPFRAEAVMARIRTQLAARCSQQIAQLQDVVRSMTHHVSSPLASIDLNLYLLKRHGRLDDPFGVQVMSRIQESTQQINTFVYELREAVGIRSAR